MTAYTSDRNPARSCPDCGTELEQVDDDPATAYVVIDSLYPPTPVVPLHRWLCPACNTVHDPRARIVA